MILAQSRQGAKNRKGKDRKTRKNETALPAKLFSLRLQRGNPQLFSSFRFHPSSVVYLFNLPMQQTPQKQRTVLSTNLHESLRIKKAKTISHRDTKAQRAVAGNGSRHSDNYRLLNIAGSCTIC